MTQKWNENHVSAVENEHQRQGWNTVRLIHSQDLLVVENTLKPVDLVSRYKRSLPGR